MPALCRDCLARFSSGRRCPVCHSPRVVAHPELDTLMIAHLDCDAFYASVEKRDHPELRDRPVIVGGGRRGVVATCCYLARISGVHSAMPMFQALKLCPEAVVIHPRIAAYAAVSRQIRAMMEELTPAIEPLSLDEAFLDLTGTERLHGAPPAVVLARLARRIEEELHLTVSIGLSCNKFLAKMASDLDKPRGFSVIGRANIAAFLHPRPVSSLWGVGTATAAALNRAGIRTIADLLHWERRDLAARFGRTGERLWHLARGEDDRPVIRDAPVRSISAETTFEHDTDDPGVIEGHVWRLAEKVARRAKAKGLAGHTVTLKMKRGDFRLMTRSASVADPTQLADRIFRLAWQLRLRAGDQGALRLIGVGLGDLVPGQEADRAGDLLDPQAERRAAAEHATDRIRARFGPDTIIKGRALR